MYVPIFLLQRSTQSTQDGSVYFILLLTMSSFIRNSQDDASAVDNPLLKTPTSSDNEAEKENLGSSNAVRRIEYLAQDGLET
jgi:hypothetical protein